MIEQTLINQWWLSWVAAQRYFWISVLADQCKELRAVFLIKVIHGVANMGEL